ncbi:helix-turn-helix domain-containing protein [Streptomyces olivoreticuli]|uniref:helix-turn-helix domain-containing protein n=1 Tax=Streptomyces olivoreticuli TaxID=68246 RepID=UPI000E23221D|nr:helix-turn-helix transcriptional regulator [Streptomyces olivoreticuli]
MGNTRRTARRRRLGSELRALREAASVSTEEAAKAIHGDKTKISRQETGLYRTTRLELEVLLNLYKAKDEKQRQWLIALSAEGNKRNWWHRHSETLPNHFKETLTLESDAASIATFQSRVVPGLLQTQAYATAVLIGNAQPLSEEQLNLSVDIRMSRQSIFLRGNPPQYATVLTEGVVRQQIGGPQIMADQLRHLAALSQTPELAIQVVPYSQKRFTNTGGSFILYSYPAPLDFDVVQVSYLGGDLFLDEAEAVAKYRKAFEELRASALSVPESAELISAIAHEFEHE